MKNLLLGLALLVIMTGCAMKNDGKGYKVTHHTGETSTTYDAESIQIHDSRRLSVNLLSGKRIIISGDYTVEYK